MVKQQTPKPQRYIAISADTAMTAQKQPKKTPPRHPNGSGRFISQAQHEHFQQLQRDGARYVPGNHRVAKPLISPPGRTRT